MTKDKDEKAVIRARMAKTGESYATARAQLSKGSAPAEDAVGPAFPRQLRLSIPAMQAFRASMSPRSTAWHLILAIRATQGTGARVLEGLGLGMPRYADVRPRHNGAPDAPVAEASWAAALAAVDGSGTEVVDSGALLRAAVGALRSEDVPSEHKELSSRLRSADLVKLCAEAEALHGSEPQEEPPNDGQTASSQGIFERFTDRARVAIVGAQEEARELGHDYIGTEHLMLGLAREGGGVAATVIRQRGLTLEVLRDEVEAIVSRGERLPDGHIPFTPRAKRVLELSLQQALALVHNYIGTEHLMLALVAEGEGIAAQVLRHYGLSYDEARKDVAAILERVVAAQTEPETG